MVKTKTVFECQTCGSQFPKWLGRCQECGGWNTLTESVIGSSASSSSVSAPRTSQVVSLSDIDVVEATPVSTGIDEFDHVLSGGLVPGSVTLIGGEPGIGKSTLVMQVVGALAEKGLSSLYASAEESASQIRGRASRLGVVNDAISLLASARLTDILASARETQCDVLVIDSIHTVLCDDISSSAGTVSQVRECAHQLTEYAKTTNTTVILIGQVTKEGTLAGPRVLEHLVDTVLSFEGDEHGFVRTLRVSKHRFGSIEGLGLFDMTEKGVIAISDPSALMSMDARERPSGLVVAAAVDGSRPFLVEVQALVVPTTAPVPRRVVQGVETARVSSIIAVLQKRCAINVSQCDVYVSLVGGIKIKDAGLDLAIAMAIASADRDVVIPREYVFAGEVGLSGEIRPVVHSSRRVREAARRGHETLFLNTGRMDEASQDGIAVHHSDVLSHVADACGIR